MAHFMWTRAVSALVAVLACLYGLTVLPIGAEGAVPANDAYEAKKAAYREAIMADDVTTDDFLIGSWVSFYSFNIDSYGKQLDQMAAAGINFNIFPRDFGEGQMYSAGYWKNVETQYAKRNMVYLMNGNMSEELVSVGVEYAAGKEHCVGYHVKDEPDGEMLTDVGEQVRRYRAADATRYPFVNLLPSYAGTAVLGGSYREHVARFVEEAGAENIEYLSHDFYPFYERTTDMNIFADMEVIRSVAYKNGKMKTHAFPQSTSWSGMRMPNIDEMRWNVYGYLAYGFKALTWFNMVCPVGFRESVISRNGVIRDPALFAAWSDLNWEVRGLSSVLMNLDTVHAYHAGAAPSGVERLPKSFFLQPSDTKARQFIVSVMEPKEGDDEYIMLFNKNYAGGDVTAAFTLDAASGVRWLEYFDPFIGEYVLVEVADGQLVDTFRVGEGKLYRLRRDDPSAATEAVTDATATSTVGETDTAGGESGCSATVGATMSAAAVLIATAAAVVLRKDEL